MGHDKLRKFAENETFDCLLQPSSKEILADGFENLRDHPIKGRWFLQAPSAASGVSLQSPFIASPASSSGASLLSPSTFPSSKSPSPSPTSSKSASTAPCPSSADTTSKSASSAPAAPSSFATPLILELGCGKGEYTLELARRNPSKNYVGVDIKGARLWRGAKTATLEGLPNVAFLRTRIEFINAFFAPDEVSEIWLTFSDPQPKSENKRLTSPVFLERYRKFLKPGGIVRLKTDSLFLHEYTKAVVEANGLKLLICTKDLYGSGTSAETIIEPEVREVKTFYESMFLEQGVPITYMAFTIDHEGPYIYPNEKFDAALWRELDGSRRSFRRQG
ncbi:MAG TPA: tRNA (guanosine(46)-N7)-methyltransferase TrmB [Candidatus Cryptobacteroides sp.]|nr:tRNA (guanosine(46)-N7)-methyltransferase TrmB [Candidatus Cryptobacteroides sp.]